jgi:rod shape-determining protein MreD
MIWLNSIFIIVTAFVVVYLEASVGIMRDWLAAQVDVLPAIMVYTALREDLLTVTVTGFLGGLWFDSLSKNNLGVTAAALLATGLALYRLRGLLMREEWHAQFLLGAAASVFCPAVSVVILMSLGHEPLLSWGSLWQFLVMAVGGGLATPLSYRFFVFLNRTFNYQPMAESSFRADRQIKRGRS